MLRLRHAIERASKRRWLGLLVVLFLALLLVLVVFHTIEHGVEDGTFLTCFAVIVFLTVTFALERLKLRRLVLAPSGRAPPSVAVAVAAPRARWPAGASPPLRL
jgi:TRAP-type C4-dicarboxylate transport system permease large subunit